MIQVAKHVVQEKNDIKLAMEFLKECPSVKIEDILPFFPDFVTIDHFKSAIVESLQDYSKHITDLKVGGKSILKTGFRICALF